MRAANSAANACCTYLAFRIGIERMVPAHWNLQGTHQGDSLFRRWCEVDPRGVNLEQFGALQSKSQTPVRVEDPRFGPMRRIESLFTLETLAS